MLLCLLALGACNIEPFHLNFDSDLDGSARVDGPMRADGRVQPDVSPFDPDARENQGCVPQAEQCDGLDNDCDNNIDNGFNFQLDPNNCGSCGNACDDALANQRGSCVAGQCHYECLPGFLDCNAGAPGCEYACIKTNGGVEACDGVDNDCDCQIDEGFNTDNDPQNCGTCLHVCLALHATPTCEEGVCGYSMCEPGYIDQRPDILGCEYRCPIFPPKTNDATCDGVDDDCDGVADEDVPGVGASCDTGQKGECKGGKQSCVNGNQVCTPNKGAVPEICGNGKDDDCDGTVDNGFDKDNDPQHCGPSCKNCTFPHAIPGCENGVCKYLACDGGWTDTFPDDQFPDHPGCDLQCVPNGPEVCDGIDNDCDGKVDMDDPDLVAPSNFCATQGACNGSTLVCARPPTTCTGTENVVAWRCQYPAAANTDECGNLIPQEEKCDGVDENCSGGLPDVDAFPVGQLCAGTGMGICRDTGHFECNGAQTGVTCHIDQPGQPATTEKCNNKDDDCDGMVDDNVKDDMVHVVDGASSFWIYQYEASHPDATSTNVGGMTTRACSQPGVQPWSLVTWTDAAAACTRAGKRLCTASEWQAACEGMASNAAYPYGATYQPNTCNGNDYDPNCTGSDDDGPLPTGTPMGCPTKPPTSACVSNWTDGKIFDMSGNLREWTATGGTLKQIRGGAYDNVSDALTCQFNFWTQSPDTFFFNLGFRCCANQAD